MLDKARMFLNGFEFITDSHVIKNLKIIWVRISTLIRFGIFEIHKFSNNVKIAIQKNE